MQSEKGERESIQYKKIRKYRSEKMKSGILERRGREHRFYVTPIEIDFHGKVYPSPVLRVI